MVLLNLLHQLCICTITWNVNSQLPDSKTSVYSLLGIDDSNFYQNQTLNSCNVPDLYVIGLQEVNSKPKRLISRLFQDDIWISKFRHVLAQRDYIAIKAEQMQGILLVVFSKRKHLLHIRDIESDNTRTGFKGFFGNKGAVSIRMNLYGCSITFVNAHLPAHDDQLDKRIHDYNYIIDHHHYHVNQNRYIFDHDYVFWFGDLNFRLEDPSLTSKDIQNMIQENQLEELFGKDQLGFVRREHKAFHQFNEEIPDFPPTFKFHIGSSEYNMKRRPAWTDRILYKIKEDAQIYPDFALGIEQISYKSYQEYTISDHKPVSGEFLINILEYPNEKIIEFMHMPYWRIEEENIIEFIIPDEFIEQDRDRIVIFPSDYSSLSDFVAYEYTSHSRKENNRRYLPVEFSDNVNLKENRDYVLLYIQSSSTHSIHCVVGISNVFRAKK